MDKEKICNGVFKAGLAGLIVSGSIAITSLIGFIMFPKISKPLENIKNKNAEVVALIERYQERKDDCGNTAYIGLGGVCLSSLLSIGAYRFNPKYKMGKSP